ncbi:MAG: protein kinase [Pirellulaceae bacterium]
MSSQSDSHDESTYKSPVEQAADAQGFLMLPNAETASAENRDPNDLPLPNIPGFCLQQPIGSGGSSTIYLAHAEGATDCVAIKVFHGTVFNREQLVRFWREVESFKKLHHPNIVSLIDFGIAQNVSPYLVLQYIDGQRIDRFCVERNLSPVEIAKLLIPVCEAIHYANDLGIIHRDLKPANILVNADGKPFVTDFGLARAVEDETDAVNQGVDRTRTGAVLGTLNYIAPEQLFGLRGQLDRRTDVFGMGAVLYKLLSGRAPFAFTSVVQAAQQYFQLLPSRVECRRSGSDSLGKICLKCLSASPDDRYASANEIAEQLQNFVDGLPVNVPRLSLSNWSVSLLRRYPWMATALPIALTVLACAAAILFFNWRSTNQSLLASETVRANLKSAILDFSAQVRRQEDDPNTIQNRREQLRLVSHHLSQLGSDLESDHELLMEAAVTKFKLGRLEHLLGNRGQELSEYAEALNIFQRMFELDPENQDVRFSIFHSLISLGRWHEGHNVIAELYREFPENTDYRNAVFTTTHQLANDSIYEERFDDARSWLEKASALIPRLAADEDEQQYFRRVAKLDFYRARCEFAVGEFELANQFANAALEHQLAVQPLESRVDSESAEYLKFLELATAIAAFHNDRDSVEKWEQTAVNFFASAQVRYPNYNGICWYYHQCLKCLAAFYLEHGDTERLKKVTIKWKQLIDDWPETAHDGEDYWMAIADFCGNNQLDTFDEQQAREALERLKDERYILWKIKLYHNLNEIQNAEPLKPVLQAEPRSTTVKKFYLSMLETAPVEFSLQDQRKLLALSGNYYEAAMAKRLAKR